MPFGVGLLLGALFLTACHNNSATTTESKFKNSLVEKKVPGTDFYISIPPNYSLKDQNGPDFSVYYFGPSDTTDKKSFRGGFYLGNAPGAFNDDSCKVEKRNAPLLGEDEVWSVSDCNNQYRIQTITKSKSDGKWGTYIHAFGRARSKTELNKLFDVYSTLKIIREKKVDLGRN